MENSLQLSPKNHKYKEKFGETKSYESHDISTAGFIKNIRINKEVGVSEPKIVSNPVNKNVFAVSANDFSIKENLARIFVSTDGGIIWEPYEISLSSKFKHSSYSDPWIDYDSDGNLFFVCVQLDMENNKQEAIFISKSENNGKTWKSDFNFIDFNNKENIELDRPKICINKSSLNENNIYVTWIEVKGFNSFIMFSKSSNNGNTFSQPLIIESNDVNFCSIISNTKGEVYAAYVKEKNKIEIKKSIDNGTSWIENKSFIKFIPPGIQSENYYTIKTSDGKGVRINPEPSLALNKENDLLIAYSAAGSGTDLSDIYFTKLNSGTLEMKVPVRVNSDNTQNDQFLPSLSSDASGNIFIIYQDSRNDSKNLFTETFVSVSNDDGKTFSDEKISTGSFNPLEITVDKYLCDYNSCVISNNRLISVWTDGRNNNFDIYAGTFNFRDFIENMKH